MNETVTQYDDTLHSYDPTYANIAIDEAGNVILSGGLWMTREEFEKTARRENDDVVEGDEGVISLNGLCAIGDTKDPEALLLVLSRKAYEYFLADAAATMPDETPPG